MFAMQTRAHEGGRWGRGGHVGWTGSCRIFFEGRMKRRIHFIGVGKMGLPMAAHFLAAGHTVSVSDASPARLEFAAAGGLTVAADACSAIAEAEVIFSSLIMKPFLQKPIGISVEELDSLL